MRIIANGLGKRFNQQWIFRNLTAQFESGKTYAILGPNGSGKSTLLQTLWGQLPASAGSIVYSAESGTIPVEDIFMHLSIATPYMDLIDEFSLEEMVRFHFAFKKSRKYLNLNDLIGWMEMEPYRNKIISQFSSGMKQRLKLGLALATDSKMIFLDEPCTNLDHKAIAWYLLKLKEVQNDTLVLIASNQETEYPENSSKINILDYK